MSDDELDAIRQRRGQIGSFVLISKSDSVIEINLNRGPRHPFANASEIDFFNNAKDDIDTLIATVDFEREQRDMRHKAWLEELKKREALQAELRRIYDSLSNDWVEIDSGPPPTEQVALYYHQWIVKMLTDYRAWTLKASRDGTPSGGDAP